MSQLVKAVETGCLIPARTNYDIESCFGYLWVTSIQQIALDTITLHDLEYEGYLKKQVSKAF